MSAWKYPPRKPPRTLRAGRAFVAALALSMAALLAFHLITKTLAEAAYMAVQMEAHQ